MITPVLPVRLELIIMDEHTKTMKDCEIMDISPAGLDNQCISGDVLVLVASTRTDGS